MAAKVFSNAGGNWNATGAWVGASVAVLGDTVTATGTSGQITVNVASACTTMILTGYVNTLTLNATLSVSGTVTFVSGMTIAGTSDLICLATATLTSGGLTLTGGLQLGGASQTFTLSGAWVLNGALTIIASSSPKLNGSTLSCVGLTLNGTMTGGGTTVITLTGGTLAAGASAYQIGNSLTFAGNVTFTGWMTVSGATLTYTSGTITTTGTTLAISGSYGGVTFATAGMAWNIININGALTVTINSLLTAATLTSTSSANVTFAGTAGFTVGTLTYTSSSGTTLTLTAANTYTITGALTLTGVTASHSPLVSSSGSVKAIVTLGPGATQSVVFCDPTRIDSSGGQAIFSYAGAITTCLNWINAFPVNVAVASPSYQLGM